MMIEMTIEELALSIKTGKTPSTRDKLNFEDGEYNWFTPGDFKTPKILKESKRKITDYAAKNNAVIYQKNTILITCIGDIGNAGIIKNEASANQQITGVVVNNNIINSEFFLYWVKANKKQIQDEANQAVVPIINNKGLRRIKVKFPSDLTTQDKIVTLLDKASVLVQKREDSIALLDELLKAQFLEIFGDPVFNPKKYSLSTLENLCHFITKGTTPKAKEIHKEPFENSVPYLKVYNISQDGSIDFHHNPSYVSQEIHSNLLKRSKVYPNDVLMNIVGPPLGKIGIVDSSFFEWNVNQAIVIFRCGKSISPIYLIATLRSKNLLGDIIRKAVGVRQLNISLEVCRNIVIPVPPIELQNQFETIYHKIQAQKETLIKSKSVLENLYNSLLQRAFNGQLNFNVDIELDALLAAIDLEQDTEKEKYDIKEIAIVYAGRLLERIEEQNFENQTEYKQAKEVVFQMLIEGTVKQEYDEVSKSVKLNLI